MKLNVAKCKEVIIDISKEKRELSPVMIDDVPFDCIQSVLILGVSLQDN